MICNKYTLLVNDPDDRDMGAKRLFTRLKAFRDEHIKVEMVPLLFGIADVVSNDPDTRIHTIASLMNVNDLPMRVIALYGTIFTKYDRKVMNEIDDNMDFEQIQNQSAKLMIRLNHIQPLINENMQKFIPMNNMFISDEHKVK